MSLLVRVRAPPGPEKLAKRFILYVSLWCIVIKMGIENNEKERKERWSAYNKEVIDFFEKIFDRLGLILKTLEKIESDIPDLPGA